MKPSVFFVSNQKWIEIGNCSTVLDVALSGEIEIGHSCGGMGSCGTCQVVVTSELAALSPRSDVEIEMAENRGFKEHERLACQLTPAAGLKVQIPRYPRT